MSKVLFDSMSWLDVNPADYVDEYLECTGYTREQFGSEDELHQQVQEWLQDNVETDWDWFTEQCGDEEKHHCLVTGYFMAWNGKKEGGKIYKDLASAVSDILLDDSHPVFSLTDEGMLILNETHHDAPCSGNYYEFRILTDAGEKYYENHMNDDPRTLHEALKLRKRTRNVNIKIFGFNSIEEVKQND